MAITIKGTGEVAKSVKSAFDKHLQSEPAMGKTEIVKEKTSHGEKTSHTLADKEEVVHPGIIAKENELCRVTVGGQRTINLGNYESAKITVSLSMPCTQETIDDTFDFASDWVSKKMEKAIGNASE